MAVLVSKDCNKNFENICVFEYFYINNRVKILDEDIIVPGISLNSRTQTRNILL